MKISHNILLAFLLLSLFSACKKDPYKYEVSGTVTEFGTNEPIAGAEVYLFDCNTDGSSTFCDTVQVLITDAAGRYNSPFLSQAGRFPMVSAFVPQYFPAGQHLVREQNDNEIDFVLDPFAWLSVRVVNEAPAGEFDRVDLGSSVSPTPGSSESLSGESVNLDYILLKTGNRELNLVWSTYNSGQLQIRGRDTISIPALDTLYYEIRY